MALFRMMQRNNVNVELLCTAVNGHYDRVSMHGIRRTLLENQTAAIGLPLELILLPEEPSMEEYESILLEKVRSLKKRGIDIAGFGDIFLEDLKQYRVNQFQPTGIECDFPIWKMDTRILFENFVSEGWKAITVCVNDHLLGKEFVGRELDASFLRDLPSNVDPCGENGEFHTFCYDGPIFKQSVPFTIGDKVFRGYKDPVDSSKNIGFWFCDLIPK